MIKSNYKSQMTKAGLWGGLPRHFVSCNDESGALRGWIASFARWAPRNDGETGFMYSA